MAKFSRPTREYPSLQVWLEQTGTTQAKLAELVGCTPPHISSILKGSRRCSLILALKLSAVTGVPVEKLTPWPKPPLVKSYVKVTTAAGI